MEISPPTYTDNLALLSKVEGVKGYTSSIDEERASHAYKSSLKATMQPRRSWTNPEIRIERPLLLETADLA